MWVMIFSNLSFGSLCIIREFRIIFENIEIRDKGVRCEI